MTQLRLLLLLLLLLSVTSRVTSVSQSAYYIPVAIELALFGDAETAQLCKK